MPFEQFSRLRTGGPFFDGGQSEGVETTLGVLGLSSVSDKKDSLRRLLQSLDYRGATPWNDICSYYCYNLRKG